jgi:hypothetical protein
LDELDPLIGPAGGLLDEGVDALVVVDKCSGASRED